MREDPRTPVLVGAAALAQREEDPQRAQEPLELLIAALERAAEDAGDRSLLARADSIRAPRGFWDYPDPCRLAAHRFGASAARTEIAEIGVLQTALLGRAAADIAAGRADVVLVAGAEARRRAQRARAAGVEPVLTRQAQGMPDSVLRPHAPILSEREIRAGLALPVTQYALLENALRAAEGVSLEAHRAQISALWAALSQVAAGNPDAWSRVPVSAATIDDPVANPLLAFPYGKLHCSQWNVDQAAGLVFCSLATARSLGLPRERWLFPLAVADANHMLPASERRDLHRCAGFAVAAERAFSYSGLTPGDVAHRELYSCFPVAVRVQLRELGIADALPTSVTGGMTFAGGPLNHFVLQALARMAQVLRAAPGAAGLLTAVSGVLTKQGVSLWSSEPGRRPFAHEDVSEAAALGTPALAFAPVAQGAARITSYTVLYRDGAPVRVVLLCDLERGGRAFAHADDADLALRATHEELCGRAVEIAAGGSAALR